MSTYTFPMIEKTMSTAEAVMFIRENIEEAESLKRMEVGEHDPHIEDAAGAYDKAEAKVAFHKARKTRLIEAIAYEEGVFEAGDELAMEIALHTIGRLQEELSWTEENLQKAEKAMEEPLSALNRAIAMRDETIRLWDGRLDKLNEMLDGAIDREVRRRSRLQRERAALDAWEAQQRQTQAEAEERAQLQAEAEERAAEKRAFAQSKREKREERAARRVTTQQDIVAAQNGVLLSKMAYDAFFKEGGERALEAKNDKRWNDALDAVAVVRRDKAVARMNQALEAAHKRLGRHAAKVKMPEVVVPFAPFMQKVMNESDELLKAWHEAQVKLTDVEAHYVPPVFDIEVTMSDADLREFMELLPNFLPMQPRKQRRNKQVNGERFLMKQLQAELDAEAAKIREEMFKEFGIYS